MFKIKLQKKSYTYVWNRISNPNNISGCIALNSFLFDIRTLYWIKGDDEYFSKYIIYSNDNKGIYFICG